MKRHWIPLDPVVDVETSRGFGVAHFILDCGIERNIQWLVYCHDKPFTGQVWIVDNSEVRLTKNFSLNRGFGSRVRIRK